MRAVLLYLMLIVATVTSQEPTTTSPLVRVPDKVLKDLCHHNPDICSDGNKCVSDKNCKFGECLAATAGNYCMNLGTISRLKYHIVYVEGKTVDTICQMSNYIITAYNAHLDDPRFKCEIYFDYDREPKPYAATYGPPQGSMTCMFYESQPNTACPIVNQKCHSLHGLLEGGENCKPPRIVDNTECCYVEKDILIGYWEKKHQGPCFAACLGEVNLPGLQTCKTCSCNHGDHGYDNKDGRHGFEEYKDLC